MNLSAAAIRKMVQPRLFAEPPPKIVQPSMFDGAAAEWRAE